jgi:hypothetical protein
VTASTRTALKVLRQFAQTSLFMCHRSTGNWDSTRARTRESALSNDVLRSMPNGLKRVSGLPIRAHLRDWRIFSVVALRPQVRKCTEN